MDSRPHSKLRSRVVACAWLAAALLSASCLVTNRVEFEQENVPANIREQRPSTFTRVLSELDQPPGCGMGRMPFQARIFDANIEDALEARLVINGELAPTTERTIAPSGFSERFPLAPFCAPLKALDRACNRVELCVSTKFKRDADPYATEDPDDIAKVEWWVLGPAGKVPQADPLDCAELLDGGVP